MVEGRPQLVQAAGWCMFAQIRVVGPLIVHTADAGLGGPFTTKQIDVGDQGQRGVRGRELAIQDQAVTLAPNLPGLGLAGHPVGPSNNPLDLQLLVHVPELTTTQVHPPLFGVKRGEQTTALLEGLREHCGLKGLGF